MIADLVAFAATEYPYVIAGLIIGGAIGWIWP
jgi:hypothetical protein